MITLKRHVELLVKTKKAHNSKKGEGEEIRLAKLKY